MLAISSEEDSISAESGGTSDSTAVLSKIEWDDLLHFALCNTDLTRFDLSPVSTTHNCSLFSSLIPSTSILLAFVDCKVKYLFLLLVIPEFFFVLVIETLPFPPTSS
jgi:hypothetical protein